MKASYKINKEWSKDNPLLIFNIIFVLIGIVILWKFRKTPGIWYGVVAMIFLGLRFWAGDSNEQPTATETE